MPIARVRNRYFLLTDLLLLALASYLSCALAFSTLRIDVFRHHVVTLGLFALLIAPPVFRRFGLYSRYWQYATVEEMSSVGLAVAVVTSLVAMAVALGAIVNTVRVMVPPVSVFIIFGMLAVIAVSGPRLLTRLATPRSKQGPRSLDPESVIVIGAGSAGSLTVQELRKNPQLGLKVVGFLDDDPAKQNLRILGIPVLGTRHDLRRVAQKCGAQRAIIAMPTARGAVIREIVSACRDLNLPALSLPSLSELLSGSVSVSNLRNVEIGDLLRRNPIHTDLQAVGQLISGKRVLVTGAGGSIGSEICRHVLRHNPASLILLGHGENSIFTIHNELLDIVKSMGAGGGGSPVKIQPVIADLRFPERLKSVFRQHRPDIVFHAAAHKHVPLMEIDAAEAAANNVLGTRNLLDACETIGVERLVYLSTDKAVNPSSVMGATKRAGELLVHQAARRTGRPYMAVRFGNVLGSRGSVVPAMQQQIAAGGPVTVTHPEMERFFMTIPEAVQLVLQAAVLGRGGEVFVFDMGKPVKVVDLARDLIRLSGLTEGEDIQIVFTGKRPGEKLYEELFLPGEPYHRTAHDKIFIAANAGQYTADTLDRGIRQLEVAIRHNDCPAVLLLLNQLVPEFQSPPAERLPDVTQDEDPRARRTPPAWDQIDLGEFILPFEHANARASEI